MVVLGFSRVTESTGSMIIKRGFIRLAYRSRSWIVHSGHRQAEELEEPAAAQSKMWKLQNKRDHWCYSSLRPRASVNSLENHWQSPLWKSEEVRV